MHEYDVGDTMNGDRVRIAIKTQSRGKRREGIIVEILERAVQYVVGTLDRGANFAFVISDNTRQQKDVFIPKEKMGDAQHGQKVVARITSYGNGSNKNPEGEIIEILGFPGEAGVDILSIAKACGLPDEFPPEVIRGAEARRDRRVGVAGKG